jgi:hypothetical protein
MKVAFPQEFPFRDGINHRTERFGGLHGGYAVVANIFFFNVCHYFFPAM